MEGEGHSGGKIASRISWLKDTIIFVVTVLTFWVLLFEISLLIYQQFLASAVQERTSVETQLSNDQVGLAVRGLGVAQRQEVPAAQPGLLPSPSWLLLHRTPIFRERLHDEVQASLKDYRDEYLAGGRRRLWVPGADLVGGDLHRFELVGAVMTNAQMKKADLREAHLDGAKLGCADLREGQLAEARLTGVFLYLADLVGAHLEGANLSQTYLEGANLSKADLTGAILDGATLYGANLAHADLRGSISWRDIADIRGANIKDVRNAPPGFVQWAKDRGAVEMKEDEWGAQQNRAAACNEGR